MQVTSSETFSVVETGATTDWSEAQFEMPRGGMVPGKQFLQERLGLTGMEISFGAMPPGGGMPFLHRHRKNEELYVFLSGTGQFQVDGNVFDVRQGTAVRVSPAGRRAYRNTGAEPLVVIVVQAPAFTNAAATVTDGEGVHEQLVWP
ncbi:MAG: cupin domain-containing protein [Deltaproteobacteria bacterium]|nr:cupin domain-containing protein [Deltaproteobacteria bacterium]